MRRSGEGRENMGAGPPRVEPGHGWRERSDVARSNGGGKQFGTDGVGGRRLRGHVHSMVHGTDRSAARGSRKKSPPSLTGRSASWLGLLGSVLVRELDTGSRDHARTLVEIDRVRWSKCGARTWPKLARTAVNAAQLLHSDLRRV